MGGARVAGKSGICIAWTFHEIRTDKAEINGRINAGLKPGY